MWEYQGTLCTLCKVDQDIKETIGGEKPEQDITVDFLKVIMSAEAHSQKLEKLYSVHGIPNKMDVYFF